MKQLTPGEELLRSKYETYNKLDQKSGGDVIKRFNHPSRVRAVQKPMKMIIKSPTKQPEPEKKKKESSSLAAFEKAKRILAAEAQAKIKAEEAKKEKAKLALKQKLSVTKSLKRPMMKRSAAVLPLAKQAKTEGNKGEEGLGPTRKQQTPLAADGHPLAHSHSHAQAQEVGGLGGGESTWGSTAVSNENDYKTIYVRKLPEDCEKEELLDLFNRYGSVESMTGIYKLKEKKGNEESKYAFITFEDAEVAKRIVHMSTIGKRPPLLRNATLYINWAKESLPVSTNNNNTTTANKVSPPLKKDNFHKGAIAAQRNSEDEFKKDEQAGGSSGLAKVQPTSDADGRNMVTYDDDFL